LGFAAGDSNLYRYVRNAPTDLADPSGEDWSDWVVSHLPQSWVNYLGSHDSDWIGNTSNFFAGWGDTLSFGVTSYVRQWGGWDAVNYNSGAYFAGQLLGIGHSFALGYYAAGQAPQTGIWAYRAAQGYTTAGTVYGVGHSSYVLITDPQNFGFDDVLGFIPLAGWVTSWVASAAKLGREFQFGPNFRLAPFGNRTGHPIGRWPHYHRRVPDPRSPGHGMPGQGIGRHRPWETKPQDKSWWERF
jgi:hypothetical protein